MLLVFPVPFSERRITLIYTNNMSKNGDLNQTENAYLPLYNCHNIVRGSVIGANYQLNIEAQIHRVALTFTFLLYQWPPTAHGSRGSQAIGCDDDVVTYLC
jgi:hypothetical protein